MADLFITGQFIKYFFVQLHPEPNGQNLSSKPRNFISYGHIRFLVYLIHCNIKHPFFEHGKTVVLVVLDAEKMF